jgi:hypothetical protein
MAHNWIDCPCCRPVYLLAVDLGQVMDIKNCPDCGGMHFGSSECPIKHPPKPLNWPKRKTMIELPPLHVLVRFGSTIPSAICGAAMLDFERTLRRLTGLRIEVFQEKRGDDSKPRAAMTPEQRAKL